MDGVKQIHKGRDRRPVVLVFCDFYLPGYKSGGSMRTLINTIDRLADEFDFRVVARDHDGKSDKTPYTDYPPNQWNSIGPALVRHLSKDRIRMSEFRKIIDEVSPDSIYFNSFFSTFTILPLILRKLGKLKGIPMIVAPEGEISEAGLKLKSFRKSAFIKAATATGLYDDLIWKVASEMEAEETRRLNVRRPKIFIAPNLSPKSILPNYQHDAKPKKLIGEARLVYLSRIHPVKNLDFLLDTLRDVTGRVILDVYGPVDADEDYMRRCRRLIDQLPESMSVTFKGGIENNVVPQTLLAYEFFVLPSLTENFGHVFLEALAAGCPLVISDRTPWTDLEAKHIGWDIPLEHRNEWVEVLDRCIRISEDEYSNLSKAARDFAIKWLADDELETATRNVIEHGLGQRPEPLTTVV